MQCRETTIDVTTRDGVMPVYVARPIDAGAYPIVVVFMDVNGIRDELKRFTTRFASAGFIALAKMSRSTIELRCTSGPRQKLSGCSPS